MGSRLGVQGLSSSQQLSPSTDTLQHWHSLSAAPGEAGESWAQRDRMVLLQAEPSAWPQGSRRGWNSLTPSAPRRKTPAEQEGV